MRIAIIIEGDSPTVDIVFKENFAELKKDKKIKDYSFFYEKKIPSIRKISSFDVVIFVRSGSLSSLVLHRHLKSFNVKTFYYLDDYIIDVPGLSSVAAKYKKKSINVAAHLMLADQIIVSTVGLKKTLSFQNKTTIIPATIDYKKFVPSDDILKQRIDSIEEKANIIITQSDRLFLSEGEKMSLRSAIEYISQRYAIKLHLFGNISEIIPDSVKDFIKYDFCDFFTYQRNLANSNFHIALVPLTTVEKNSSEEIFSDCKNKIKYLNYALAGIPGIYSLPYAKKIEYKHCLYSDNSETSWIENIEKLLNDREFYKRQTTMGTDSMKSGYDLPVSMKLFMDVMNSTRRSELMPVDYKCVFLLKYYAIKKNMRSLARIIITPKVLRVIKNIQKKWRR